MRMDFNAVIEYFTSKNIDVLLPLCILIFLAIVIWGDDIWQNIFTIAFGVKGMVLLLFPQRVAEYVVLKPADALHLQELRCVGILLLTDFFSHVLTRKSNDPTVKATLLWSRTLFFALHAVLLYTTISLPSATDSKKNNMNLKLIDTQLLMMGLMTVGFLYYAITLSDWGGYSEQDASSRKFHIRTDFFIWFAHGMLTFVFPKIACQFQTTLSELDNAHGYLARGMGVGFITMSLVALRTSNFFSEEDKRSILLSHGIGNMLFLMTMAFCQVFTKVFSEWHLYYGMSFVAVTAINAFMGCDLINMVKLARLELKRFLANREVPKED